jgi:S1-C subfamily serine protease
MSEQDSNKTTPSTGIIPPLSTLVRKAGSLTQFFAGALAFLLALTLYNHFNAETLQFTENDIRETVFQAMASATPPPAYSTQVYQIIRPSLVLIQTSFDSENTGQNDSLGSGVVINTSGDILTSLHVVAGSGDIQIIYADGTRAEGVIIAAQPENDLAVLGSSLVPEIIVPAILGNPNSLRAGDEAFAVGNPFGLYGSVSAGVISGFGRTFQPEGTDVTIENLIQIDAAVNPGNSGGPLLNRSGHVVGIVVGIINPTEESFFVGIGFAVPIDIAGGAAGIPPY